MIKTFTIISCFICLLLISVAPASAEAYAPLLDTSGVKNSYFRSLSSLELPNKDEVPVTAYIPASLLYVSTITSTGDSQFQENRIVYLVTTDSQADVIDFYDDKLSGWNRKVVKNKEIFLKTGKQFFWGGSQRLDGPRVEVVDLASGVQSIDVPIVMLQKSFPNMKTAIKIFYEQSSTPLVDVEVPKLIASCVAKEIESKSKIYGGNPTAPEAQKFLKNTAESACKKVEKACLEDENGRNCQRFARLYQ